MKASVSPSQLSFFGFDDVQVVSNDAFDSENNGAVTVSQDVEIGVREGDADRVVHVNLAVRIDQDFWLKHMNAPAILYGLARSEIARLTTSNRFGQYILPSIDLISMARDEFMDEMGKEKRKSRSCSEGEKSEQNESTDVTEN